MAAGKVKTYNDFLLNALKASLTGTIKAKLVTSSSNADTLSTTGAVASLTNEVSGNGYAEQTLDEIRREGIDIDALAAKLQQEGGDSFKKSWSSLIGGLNEKVTKLTVTSPS